MEPIQPANETTAVDLADLLNACDDAVVTLVAGEARLVGHRAVLSDRSPVFAAMFRHDTLESRSGRVSIMDVEGPVLRLLLACLYTMQAPRLPDIDTATSLLVAADKYGVAGLKVACEQQLAAQLSVETAAAAAVLGVRHSCESLTQASIAFIRDHTHEVMATRAWEDARRSQPEDLEEVNRLLVAEIRRLSAREKGRRLLKAAKQGALEVLDALLAAGADVAATDGSWRKRTALQWAAQRGHVEAARWLVARGAPVDASDFAQRTPLHWAACHGHTAVVRMLLAASADHSARRSDGWTPLHLAAFKGHTEIAAALLEAGADRAIRDHFWGTPLDLARYRNHQQLVELLTRTADENVAVRQPRHDCCKSK